MFWQVAAAATLTTSVFQGNILAQAAISTTGGVFAGRALSGAGVTMTNTIVTGCDALPGAPSCKPNERLVCEPKHRHHGHKDHKKCNQGVGNGPEGCDPGNSNQDGHNSYSWPFSSRSNDELGGRPGDPGRKGGNN